MHRTAPKKQHGCVASATTKKPTTKKPPTKNQKTLKSQKRQMSRKKLTVVLAKDVEEIGKAGDLVALKPGTARNHLFPKGLAVYDTRENRAALAAKGLEIQDVVIDKEAEMKAAATRPYATVQGDVLRNMQWNFKREPVSSADNHVKKPITKRDVLTQLRISKFFFVEEKDIEFPPGVTELNHCGTWPCAVAFHLADASEYQLFDVNVIRVDTNLKDDSAEAAAV